MKHAQVIQTKLSTHGLHSKSVLARYSSLCQKGFLYLSYVISGICTVAVMNCETQVTLAPEPIAAMEDSVHENSPNAEDIVEATDSGNSGKIEDTSNEGNGNPYAYLERSEFSSEKYKIEIMNLHKYCTPNV